MKICLIILLALLVSPVSFADESGAPRLYRTETESGTRVRMQSGAPMVYSGATTERIGATVGRGFDDRIFSYNKVKFSPFKGMYSGQPMRVSGVPMNFDSMTPQQKMQYYDESYAQRVVASKCDHVKQKDEQDRYGKYRSESYSNLEKVQVVRTPCGNFCTTSLRCDLVALSNNGFQRMLRERDRSGQVPGWVSNPQRLGNAAREARFLDMRDVLFENVTCPVKRTRRYEYNRYGYGGYKEYNICPTGPECLEMALRQVDGHVDDDATRLDQIQSPGRQAQPDDMVEKARSSRFE